MPRVVSSYRAQGLVGSNADQCCLEALFTRQYQTPARWAPSDDGASRHGDQLSSVKKDAQGKVIMGPI